MSGVENVIVVYGGRFQPPHPGHYNLYKKLVQFFGENNVYISTSDKVDLKNKTAPSPFNFEEKKFLWTKLFDVPSSRIVFSKNPIFRPEEILSKYDSEKTAYVTVTSAKDAIRYANVKNFEPYPLDFTGNPMPVERFKKIAEPYAEKAYYIIMPIFSENVSATKIREIFFDQNKSDEEKIEELKKIYGHFNKEIYNFMKSRIEKIKK